MNLHPPRASNASPRRSSSALRAACAIGLFAGGLLSTDLRAAPLLRCQVEGSGTTRTLEFSPVTDPYSVAPIDINDHFRFKAVVVGTATRVEYIKLYVYVTTKREPMLIHATNYLAPEVSHDTRPAALTGINHVYAPRLERELQYGCALLEARS
ncbi:hypothetical protein ACHAC9_14990 [Massilia sp. CMS3.1]|uniref:hypothetical protein n=1 Tax=Massilia sp. CMS3.1 TaxID=3373083 RepID=UPI003EE7FC44